MNAIQNKAKELADPARFRNLDVRFLPLAPDLEPEVAWMWCVRTQGREPKRFFMAGHCFRHVTRYREVCGNRVTGAGKRSRR